MKAARLHRYGEPDALVHEEAPVPVPAPGQVLIRVESASVNYSDVIRRRNGAYPFPTPLPAILGGEVAGRVETVGDKVRGVAVGDFVFAVTSGTLGGYAQYAVADAEQTIAIPLGMDADRACTLVIAGVTALQTLREMARLQPGESVFIPGAGGGVGSYAVQVARILGARPILAGASTPAKRAWALEMGADHAVDYTRPGWSQTVRVLTGGRGADVILEMSGGGAMYRESVACLAPFGRLVVHGNTGRESGASEPTGWMRGNQSLLGYSVSGWFRGRPAQTVRACEDLARFVLAGEVEVRISHVLPLSRAAEAHEIMESRQATGKIVLKPWSD